MGYSQYLCVVFVNTFQNLVAEIGVVSLRDVLSRCTTRRMIRETKE